MNRFIQTLYPIPNTPDNLFTKIGPKGKLREKAVGISKPKLVRPSFER